MQSLRMKRFSGSNRVPFGLENIDEQHERETSVDERQSAVREFHFSLAMSTLSVDLSDLPMQFHKEMVEMWARRKSTTPLIPASTAALEISTNPSEVEDLFHGKRRRMELSEDEDSLRKSRFRNLDPAIFIKRLSRLPKFNFLRDLAINKLYTEILKKLEIYTKGAGCQEREEVPHRVFSWKLDDFLERRRLKSIVWVDLMIKNISASCLQKKKLKCDLEEFLSFVELILDGSMDKNLAMFKTDVLRIVEDAHDFLRVEQYLRDELADNYSQVRKYLNKQLALTLSKHVDSERNEQLMEMETRIIRSELLDPIEIRYQIRYFAAAEEGIIHRLTSTEGYLIKEIARIQKQLQSETYCSQCSLNTYYMHVERYKTEIATLTQKYNREFDNLEAEIAHKKLSIEKIRQQMLYFTEQIQRFHEELEDLRLERLELLKLEEKRKKEAEAARIRKKQMRAERMRNKKKKKSKK